MQFDNLIEEIGTGVSTGGRKPTLLKLKTGVPAAIGNVLSGQQAVDLPLNAGATY
ncbi:MAG: hypothetical protein ACR2N3_16555 [Pyrinomonadaceae bacterium]